MGAATELASGLSVEQLAATGMRAFHAAIGTPDAADLAHPTDDWRAAAGWAAAAWDHNRGSDQPLAVAALVRGMYAAVCGGDDAPAFDDLGREFRVALEAACRHLLGAAECDPEDTRYTTEREASWAAWARGRLAEPEGQR